MKNYLFKLVLVSLSWGALFLPIFLKAEILDDNFDLNHLKGQKLGYYIGSFDPIHLGHQQVIEQALKEGHVDYVLIYPAPGGDQFKNRTNLSLRQKMIESVYEQHPKVLFTHWTPKELQDKFAVFTTDLEIIGIIGSDVVTETLMGKDKELSEKYRSVFMRGIPLKEKHYEDTVGALMALKASSFLVALRGDIDLFHLDGKIYDRPIRAFIQSSDYSSTKVRNAISEETCFEQFLSFNVQGIVKEEGLYGLIPRIDNSLREMLREMQEKDQLFRMNRLNRELSSEEWNTWETIDRVNGKKLHEIVNQYGWPGVSRVGLAGTYAMWLLVQHQDDDIVFQKKCLELLKDAVAAYESPISNYAYLLDRINSNMGIPQIYGTQWTTIDGKVALYPVEDIQNLDVRRSDVGLCSLSEYKEQMKILCHLTDSDFK